MHQLSKTSSVLYHLYPGVFITVGFIFLAPLGIRHGYPPQFGMMLSILLVALPILLVHLLSASKKEERKNILELNGYREKLPTGRLILYSIGLVFFAFLMWGMTQPLTALLTEKLFGWLPAWYTVQDFAGFDKSKILVTLILNLLLNGFLAPYIEELYFRGYLLPRMKAWGRYAFVVSTILFSLYHFWQPYIYVTLILSLLPMTYLVWRTKDLRLGILTHSLLNLVGALLSFGLLNK